MDLTYGHLKTSPVNVADLAESKVLMGIKRPSRIAFLLVGSYAFKSKSTSH